MGFPVGISGFRPTTPQNMILNAGAAFRCVNIAKLRDLLSSTPWEDATDPDNTWTYDGSLVVPTALGATRGGAEVSLNNPLVQPDIDGLRQAVKGLDRRDEMNAMIKVTLLELRDVDTLKMGIGSADVEEHGVYTEVTPRLGVEDEDYIGNIAIAATVKGSNEPIVVVAENVIVANAFTMQWVDKNQAALAVELRASALITAPYDVPIHFFTPILAGSGS